MDRYADANRVAAHDSAPGAEPLALLWVIGVAALLHASVVAAQDDAGSTAQAQPAEGAASAPERADDRGPA